MFDFNLEPNTEETCYDCDCIEGWLPPLGESDMPTPCPHFCHLTHEDLVASAADHVNDIAWEEGGEL